MHIADWAAHVLRRPLPNRLVKWFAPLATRKTFPLWACLAAFLATLSLTMPVVPLLSALVVLNHRRWRGLVVWTVLGSASAGALFVHVLGHWGGAFIAARMPEVMASSHWQHTVRWISDYGMFALAAVAASPIAQTPALILVAILGMPSSEVLLSLLVGKGIKYGISAAVVARTVEQAVPGTDVHKAKDEVPRRSDRR